MPDMTLPFTGFASHGLLPAPGVAIETNGETLPSPAMPGEILVQFKAQAVRESLSPMAERIGLMSVTPGSSQDLLLEQLRADYGLRAVEPVFVDQADPVSRSLAAPAVFRRAMAASVTSRFTAPDDAGYAILKFPSGRGDAEVLRLLLRDPLVQLAEPVPRRWLSAVRAPSAHRNRQWGLRAIGFFDAKRVSAATVPVALLDSGIDASHPLLKGRTVRRYEHFGWRAEDLEGHGTHVAGTIAARSDEAAGVCGIADCPLLVWKVIADQAESDGRRYVSFKEYLAALSQVETSGARVLNLSLGGNLINKTEQQVLKRLAAADIFIVAAMGNHHAHGNPTMYPAAFKGTHGVAATDELGQRSRFSNTGAHAFIAAPGSHILSTAPVGGAGQALPYACLDGTSMASAHVAGAVALIRARYPHWSVQDVAAALAASARAAPGQIAGKRTHAHGHGLLNLEAVLKLPQRGYTSKPRSVCREYLFKLKHRASQKARLEVAHALQAHFHVQPEPMFPGTAARDLADIFSLDVPSGKAQAVMQTLADMTAVEYVEAEPKRQLFAQASR